MFGGLWSYGRTITAEITLLAESKWLGVQGFNNPQLVTLPCSMVNSSLKYWLSLLHTDKTLSTLTQDS